jgi:NAD+ kinase
MYQRIGITVKSDLRGDADLLRKIVRIIRTAGCTPFIDAKRMRGLPCAKGCKTFSMSSHIDVLIVVGGDGTILRAVRELHPLSIPILSINRGTVGFLAEMSATDVATLLPRFLRGDGDIDRRSVLHVTARRGKKIFLDGYALNEAVIAQGSIARLIDLRASVDGHPLTVYRADGLIIATPTGSTAYTLAAGGPIVHPHLAAAILTPINSHAFTQKPIVVPATQRIDVEVLGKPGKFGDTEVSLTLDGQSFQRLKAGDVISADISEQTLQFLRRRKDAFYGTLREKLKWGERPGA